MIKYIPLKKDQIVKYSHFVKRGRIYLPFEGVSGFYARNYNEKIYRRTGKKFKLLNHKYMVNY